MPTLTSADGVELSYETRGVGLPVLLLHGFTSSARGTWVDTGISAALIASGHQVILPDCRGHGASAKPHSDSSYELERLVGDARALLDHLGVERLDVAGYSMGSVTALTLGACEPRVRALVLGGIGKGVTRDHLGIATALETAARTPPGAPDDADPVVQRYRRLTAGSPTDLLALAAFQRAAARRVIDPSAVRVPTRVITGDRDQVVGSPADLAAEIPGATFRVVPGDHLSALGHPLFVRHLVDFLAPGGVADAQ